MSKTGLALIIMGLVIAVSAACFFIGSHLNNYSIGPEVRNIIRNVSTGLILITLLYPLRKYFLKAGNLKTWLWVHEVSALVGTGLLLVHISAYRVHALAPWITFLIMASISLSCLLGRVLGWSWRSFHAKGSIAFGLALLLHVTAGLYFGGIS